WRVLMIGRRDDHRVDAGLREEIVIIDVAPGVRRRLERRVEVGLVDFRDGDALRAELLEVALQISPAPARPQEAGADAVIRAERRAGNEQGRGGEGSCKKGTAVLWHGGTVVEKSVEACL